MSFDAALKSLTGGIGNLTIPALAMILAGVVLIYLAIKYKPVRTGVSPSRPPEADVERDAGGEFAFSGQSVLLIPIGFGAILANLPITGLTDSGLLTKLYDIGIQTPFVFPCLIFIGLGAIADFTPLLVNPKLLLVGAAGQFGIFLVVIPALMLGQAFPNAFGFTQGDSCAIGIIGACNGPVAIYVSSKYARELLPAIAIAVYVCIALLPIIQLPIMRLLYIERSKCVTTPEERKTRMEPVQETISYPVRVLFPVVVTVFTGLIAPKGAPLIGMLMFGNFLKECGVTPRLSQVARNELLNLVFLLLGLTIGATMVGTNLFRTRTLVIFALGLAAIILNTICGLLMGKLMSMPSPFAERAGSIPTRGVGIDWWTGRLEGQLSAFMAVAVMLTVLS